MLGALHVAYGHNDVTFQGPFPTAIIANVNTQHSLDIQYNHGQVQLTVKNTQGFEVNSIFFSKPPSSTPLLQPFLLHLICGCLLRLEEEIVLLMFS